MLSESFALRFLLFLALVTLCAVVGIVALKYAVAHSRLAGLQAVVGAA